jgi:hypothetical protein
MNKHETKSNSENVFTKLYNKFINKKWATLTH